MNSTKNISAFIFVGGCAWLSMGSVPRIGVLGLKRKCALEILFVVAHLPQKEPTRLHAISVCKCSFSISLPALLSGILIFANLIDGNYIWGAWVAELVKPLTLAFSSDHDLLDCGIQPLFQLAAQRRVCLGILSFPLHMRALALSNK